MASEEFTAEDDGTVGGYRGAWHFALAKTFDRSTVKIVAFLGVGIVFWGATENPEQSARWAMLLAGVVLGRLSGVFDYA